MTFGPSISTDSLPTSFISISLSIFADFSIPNGPFVPTSFLMPAGSFLPTSPSILADFSALAGPVFGPVTPVI